MPRELPGFYFDSDKNRYFPLKGPIPGSSSSSSAYDAPKPTEAIKVCRRTRMRISKLIQARELSNNVIDSRKGRCNFKEELLKIRASRAMVWKYQETEKMGDGALNCMRMCIHTPEGETGIDGLITGSANGSLSIFEVGKVRQHFDTGVNYNPDLVGTITEPNNRECYESPGHIWKPERATLQMPSSISCIKLFQKHPSNLDDDFSIQRALITTLGSETSGGSLSILDLSEPLGLYTRTSMRRLIRDIASFNCTIWTADCKHNASQAVVGTNFGAAVVDLETGLPTWTCRSKSDVLAVQLDQSGNNALCGLRNGAIVTVDVREKREVFSIRLVKHRIPYSPPGKLHQKSSKQWFELSGNIDPSCTLYMPSSICCLVSLQSYEQYFLASSMDGSMKLYDHRMVKRGAVQSYEGHVNSHTRLQIGVDQSERFLMAGGEDCKLRIWSIKSAELLYEEKVSDSVISTICWNGTARSLSIPNENRSNEDLSSLKENSLGSWCGSQDGLFYVLCS
ncbi:Transducin/WD40 repeat-like superfamily protein [Euphorbia peplus]|nr:Transducin/WD40 repeat-like superfamily protein [Euphorbia peplus]